MKRLTEMPLVVADDVSTPVSKRTGSRRINDLDEQLTLNQTDELIFNRNGRAFRVSKKTLIDDAINITSLGDISADTLALQAAFLAGGDIKLSSELFTINDTLIVSREVTKINSGIDTEIRMAPSIGKTLLETAAIDATPVTIASFTSSNHVGTITSTSHGYNPDEYIFIHSAETDGYNGVYKVETVPTPNTLTVRLPYVPVVSTAVGTIISLPGTEKVVIDCGTWNYDHPNNPGSAGGTNVHSIIMAGVHTVTISNLNMLDTPKFAIYIAGCQNVMIDNIDFSTDSDGIHTLGPIYSAHYSRIKGLTGDNMIAVAPAEGTWTAVLPYKGSINSVTVDGLYPENSFGGCFRMFSSYTPDPITVSGIQLTDGPLVTTSSAHNLNPRDVIKFGTIVGMTEMTGRVMVVGEVTSSTTFKLQDVDTSAYTVFISGACELISQFKIKQATLRDARYAPDDTPNKSPLISGLVVTNNNCLVIDSLIIDSVYGDDALNGQMLFLTVASGTEGAMFIDSVTFKSVSVDLPAGGSPGDFAVMRLSKAPGDEFGQLINDVYFVNCNIKGSRKQENHRCVDVFGVGQVKRFHFTDSKISALHSALNCASAGIVDGYEVYVSGVSFNDGLAAFSSTTAKMTIYATNLVGRGMLYGIVRSNLTSLTHTVIGQGIEWNNDPIDTVGSTGFIRALGLGIRTDAAQLTAQDGDYVWDTATNRPVYYDATSSPPAWVGM